MEQNRIFGSEILALVNCSIRALFIKFVKVIVVVVAVVLVVVVLVVVVVIFIALTLHFGCPLLQMCALGLCFIGSVPGSYLSYPEARN